MKLFSSLTLLALTLSVQSQNFIINNSFEISEDGTYPNTCTSGTTSNDVFAHCFHWHSWFLEDNRCAPTVYTHSPDWIGKNDQYCGAWDGDYYTGMGDYEMIQEYFGERFEEGKCYEMKIKFKPVSWTNTEADKFNLDVTFSDDYLFYKKNEYYYDNGNGNLCATCHPDYGTYQHLFPWNNEQTLLSFDMEKPINLSNTSLYSTYSSSSTGYFELHGRFSMDQSSFPIAVSAYDWINIDIRSRAIPHHCSGAIYGLYSIIDYIELYPACQNIQKLDGVIISGQQEPYEAAISVRAGDMSKGNVVIANNGKTAFHGARTVFLLPGFMADYGSTLLADNAGCSGCRDGGQGPDGKKTIRDFRSADNVEMPLKKDIQVFPNPASDKVYIEGLTSLKQITLSDLSGRTIKSQFPQDENKTELSLDGIAPGIYLLNIADDAGNVLIKKLSID